MGEPSCKNMDSPFPDVERRVSLTSCMKCLTVFQRGDTILQAWLVAGVGLHPGTYRRVPFLNEVPGFVHVRCHQRTAEPIVVPEIERHLLKPTENKPLRPRTPEYQCHLCKKPFQRGDVINVAVRVIGIGIDPSTRQPATECSEEYEAIHIDCRDPKLDLGGTLVITS